MPRDEVRRVDAADWHEAVRDAHASGLTWLDLLTCVDEIGREDAFRLVLRIAPHPDADGVRLETLVDRTHPVVASICDVFGGAAWREREIRDFFGVRFTGGDNRLLLLRPEYGGHPLRRDAVLGARALTPWPGAKEAGDATAARRRMVPPGVPDPDVWGDRTGEPADPAEVAASQTGGRVRRQR